MQPIIKRLYFLLLSYVIITNAYTQHVNDRRIPVDLNAGVGSKTLLSPNATIPGVRVIYLLPDSGTIGYLRKSEGNETSRLLPSSMNAGWLQSFADSRFGSSFDRSGKNLLWVLQELAVSEDSTASITFARCKAKVYVAASGDSYTLLTQLDTIVTVTDQGNRFGNALAEVLQQLLVKSLDFHAKHKALVSVPDEKGLTESEIISQLSQINDLPILKDSVYRNGLYLSWEDFKNNKSSHMNAFVRVDTIAKKLVPCYEASADNFVDVTTAWGIAINGELYAYKNGTIIPIEKSGKSFIISRFQDPDIRKNQAMYWRNDVGRRLSDTNPYSRQHSFKVNLKNTMSLSKVSPPEATRIDMETGELSF